MKGEKYYLLIGSKEGGEWKQATLFCEGSIDKIENLFKQRKRPYILWYLIDTSKLPQKYNSFRQLDLLFFNALKMHKDLVEKDYHYDPFVGFYDMVAKNRSWGILKDLVEKI